MACDTKERIIEEALRLFSEKGYAGTSMSDIAERLKITKAALYKHYSGKREIFQKILDRMSALDAERAAEYDMPGRRRICRSVYEHRARQHTPIQYCAVPPLDGGRILFPIPKDAHH